ncbi:hypothetical protein NDU88_005287 [Pleurodeles waltl]|uniref:Uncharacterized protein n=1 Tax=Pleurodeles waltl TaxID=8319 RepID=A0AAV7L3K7_PLEWA|nr:hypothetical protein NDU88_005287 [Pleurodeles waltl]
MLLQSLSPSNSELPRALVCILSNSLTSHRPVMLRAAEAGGRGRATCGRHIVRGRPEVVGGAEREEERVLGGSWGRQRQAADWHWVSVFMPRRS